MARYGPKAREHIAEHVPRHRKKYGMPPKQAVAVAISEARAKGYKVPERHNPSLSGFCLHHFRFCEWGGGD